MTFGHFLLVTLTAFGLMACTRADDKDTALIATATNFRTTFDKLESVFEAETGFDVTQVSGATGSLYTQIVNGAPYHVFLSADELRPQKLRSDGLASQNFVYARGELVLWSKSENVSKRALPALLQDPNFKPIAMANPRLAPYGQAAQEVLMALGVQTGDSVVMGENVGQAFALVQSGNAQAGFVAKSDAMRFLGGFHHVVSPAHYTPIKQQAALLTKGESHAAAQAFFAYLQSPEAQMIIQSDGYNRLQRDLP